MFLLNSSSASMIDFGVELSIEDDGKIKGCNPEFRLPDPVVDPLPPRPFNPFPNFVPAPDAPPWPPLLPATPNAVDVLACKILAMVEMAMEGNPGLVVEFVGI